jgi:hypothetical protein
MTEDRSAWRPFIERACQAVGVDAATVDEDLILELTAKIAHDGERPMAPVGAYILGLAVASGLGEVTVLRDRIEAVI